MSFLHTASIYMSPSFPSTSVAVISQASMGFSSLHAGGFRAQSLSSLTMLTLLMISSSLMLLNATYVPQTPTFISLHQIQAVCNCAANTDILMLNRHIKLSSLTELRIVPHSPPLPIAFSTSADGRSTYPYAQANKLGVIPDISLPLIHI